MISGRILKSFRGPFSSSEVGEKDNNDKKSDEEGDTGRAEERDGGGGGGGGDNVIPVDLLRFNEESFC